MRTLAIIPARGGSKGVPRKNIRIVGGKPLIAHTIEAAKHSRFLSEVITSTDDIEIAQIAEACGSPVLMRPAELAADDTPMFPVIEHALSVAESTSGPFDCVALLQPTSPLRTVRDIDDALSLLAESGADSVVSVYRVEDHHPSRMYRMVDECLVPYEEESPERLRQKLAPVYHRNGAIYASRREVISVQRTILGKTLRGYVMPRSRSVNIDDELDLIFAGFLLDRNTP